MCEVQKGDRWPISCAAGNGANVARIVPNYALKFSLNDTFKNMVRQPGQANSDLTVPQLVSCSAMGGFLQAIPAARPRSPRPVSSATGVAPTGLLFSRPRALPSLLRALVHGAGHCDMPDRSGAHAPHSRD